MNVQPAIVELLYAVGIGLFVGFEREHKDLSAYWTASRTLPPALRRAMKATAALNHPAHPASLTAAAG